MARARLVGDRTSHLRGAGGTSYGRLGGQRPIAAAVEEPRCVPETGALAYRFENLKLAEQIAVIDVAERAKQAEVATQDAMSKWLAEQSIQVG